MSCRRLAAASIFLTLLSACPRCGSSEDDDGENECFLVLCFDGTHCVDGECLECTSNGDCSDGDQCVDTECVECIDDADCTDGLCDGGQCVECIGGEDCAPGEVCSVTSCVDDPGCGDVDEAGECDGDVLRACVDGVLRELRCDAVAFFPASAFCAVLGVEATCVVPDGDPCLITLDDADAPFTIACDGDAAGCRATGTSAGVCAVDVGACTEADVGTCLGALFVQDCPTVTLAGGERQPFVVDCAPLAGAACTDGVGCLVAPGAPCATGLTSCGTSAADALACPTGGACP